ncbi:MAG: ribonuclease P protein component [Thermoanaerobaculia bacterium]|nr:ribonuclease P protein component [Thermoanaerobaculia bacterium]
MIAGDESAAEGAHERFRPEDRIRKRADYLRCYHRGRRRSGRLLRAHVHPNRLGHPRLGITASRRVGNSVVRHRVKRRLREIYRRWPRRSELPPLDIVFHVLPPAADAGFGDLATEAERLLRGLIDSPR